MAEEDRQREPENLNLDDVMSQIQALFSETPEDRAAREQEENARRMQSDKGSAGKKKKRKGLVHLEHDKEKGVCFVHPHDVHALQFLIAGLVAGFMSGVNLGVANVSTLGFDGDRADRFVALAESCGFEVMVGECESTDY